MSAHLEEWKSQADHTVSKPVDEDADVDGGGARTLREELSDDHPRDRPCKRPKRAEQTSYSRQQLNESGDTAVNSSLNKVIQSSTAD